VKIQVYADELIAFKNSSICSSLKNDSKESGNVESTISEFVTMAKGRLIGSGWDNVSAKLNEFQSVLLKRIEVANSLSDSIESAINLILDYMGEYPFLDCSQLDEIKDNKKQCEANIEIIKKAMYATKTESVYDSNIEGYKQVTVNVYSSSEIEEFQRCIDKLEESISEIQKLINKLEGLGDIYKQAEGILEGAFSQVNSFGSLVSKTVPNNKVVYVK
jgi:hypothetical protein